MVPSEEFLRHATECAYMAKFSRDPNNKRVWSRMAERWIRCADLARELDPPAGGRRKVRRRAAPGFAQDELAR